MRSLPNLTGIRSRVVDATRIRAAKVAEAESVISRIKDDTVRHTPEQIAAACQEMERLLSLILEQTDAEWWISHENSHIRTMEAELRRERREAEHRAEWERRRREGG